MQKTAKKKSLLSLWEVRKVLMSILITTVAVWALLGANSVREARLAAEEAQKQEEYERQQAIEAEEREAARAASEAAEAARIAAGPFVTSTDAEGNEIWTVSYDLGVDSMTVDGSCSGDYEAVLDLKNYTAFNGGDDFDFCYHPGLYTKIEETSERKYPDEFHTLTMTDERGSSLIREWQYNYRKDHATVLREVYNTTMSQLYFTGEILEEMIYEDYSVLLWKGTKSGSVARGLIYTSPGNVWKVTVICPSSANAQYTAYYMESVISLIPLSEKGSMLTWEAYSGQ